MVKLHGNLVHDVVDSVFLCGRVGTISLECTKLKLFRRMNAISKFLLYSGVHKLLTVTMGLIQIRMLTKVSDISFLPHDH